METVHTNERDEGDGGRTLEEVIHLVRAQAKNFWKKSTKNEFRFGLVKKIKYFEASKIDRS